MSAIKLALEQLGYPNVYHMSTFIDHPEDHKHWARVIKAKRAGQKIHRSVWDELFGGYQVSTSITMPSYNEPSADISRP